VTSTSHPDPFEAPLRRGFCLSAGEIHLWLVNPREIADPILLNRYRALLDTEEQARLRRIRLPGVRHQYLLTRALVRTALSRYAPLSPRTWRFRPNPHGRPLIANSEGRTLCFNLAHTEGMIVCAVTRDAELGVDVECTLRATRTAEVADRFFADIECRDLHALSADRRRDRFFDYWTLKEAYIKARGLGLACPLGKFAFRLREGERITLKIDPELADDGGRWYCRLGSPSDRHRLALCSTSAEPPRSWYCVPMGDARPSALVLDDRAGTEGLA
jgi:4'-phosphopantetheinyl transferase